MDFFQWDPDDQVTEPSSTAAWSGRGLLQAVLSCAGWLLLIPAWWLAETPLLGGSFVGWWISLLAAVFAVLVSIAAILIACVRRSWGVAVVSLCLAAAAFVVVSRQDSQVYPVDYRYRLHRAALAELAKDYRAGHLNGGLTLPADMRSLCPSGVAYATPTVLFIQLWQNWRAESGTGLAYFAEPPTESTVIETAWGDQGYPQREVGDGWWWVA
ncbi:hypothetical protein [Actinoplanes regularis]|uniref:Uncharacterized protein n=1 Tax=Actinoplanes regularis TaxID=52697 RepID=A0A239FBX4_9ACTN|nr:hypothetical protein [Actinoplanes regularis]GIE89523.1 hypothetical protein Are01nite_60030 [Actinoplanes regularis]SNS54275.1 hypothetical protein SAMN06264365_1184 [Actinoplanes regularis]